MPIDEVTLHAADGYALAADLVVPNGPPRVWPARVTFLQGDA
jgi:hypothetical protein